MVQPFMDDNDDEILLSLTHHMYINNHNDMDNNDINNEDSSEVDAPINKSQSSVNENEPIKCCVPPMKEFDEQLKQTGKTILSKYKAETKITEMYPVKPVYYDYYQNGCQMYTDYVSIACPCGQHQYKQNSSNNLQAVSTMLYMLLAEQLVALISNDTRRNNLITLADRESEEHGVQEDFFDGNMHKGQKSSLFKRDLDIAISLFIDGFTPFCKGKSI
ncbi:hypothetical protein BDA99DRAFT_565246 [Phascolomyces articulosus]|uniref:Uncharacterized protein n=1 Tax=Phascolomyces articulosus TaxID=60185 RepID=A0AAD5JZP5_9FUNG|nr:hypothetical protein BDA99DRAFT_565246 [Phascolomyces articulosus]